MQAEMSWLHFVALFLYLYPMKSLASYAENRYTIASKTDYLRISVTPLSS